MNVLLLTSHSIAEYDDLRMLTDLGYDVFSIGAYTDPHHPTDDKRPALPQAPQHPDLAAACDRQRVAMTALWGDPGRGIDWAKARLHDDVIDWADVIIVHHFPESWIAGQWDAIKHKRVIWRTCGQSDPRLESVMEPFHRDGLQIVRYSPAERRAFEPMGMWAGQDAVIRFGKYPADYGREWLGDIEAVGNITQNMAQRGDACGFDRWLLHTQGLEVQPAGPGSKVLGGVGELTYEDMLVYLSRIRVYLYTGTTPASYTLGLMEAMLAGVPVVPAAWDVPSMDYLWLGRLWEANELVPFMDRGASEAIAGYLENALWDPLWAQMRGRGCRERAIELFGIETVGPQWKAFLG